MKSKSEYACIKVCKSERYGNLLYFVIESMGPHSYSVLNFREKIDCMWPTYKRENGTLYFLQSTNPGHCTIPYTFMFFRTSYISLYFTSKLDMHIPRTVHEGSVPSKTLFNAPFILLYLVELNGMQCIMIFSRLSELKYLEVVNCSFFEQSRRQRR